MKLYVVILCALAVLLAAPAPDAQGAELSKELKAKQREAKAARARMLKLSAKERALFKDLAGLEARVGRQEKALAQARQGLSQSSTRREELEAQGKQLTKRRAETHEQLTRLTQALWPAHLERRSQTFGGVPSWPEAERRFSWMASAQRRLDALRMDYQQQGAELAAALTKLEEAEGREAKALKTAENTAGKLLAERLKLLRRIKAIRAKEVTAKRELAAILEDAARLDEELAQARRVRRPITLGKSKGKLPWPARGKIIQKFSPKAKEPSRGIGMALRAGSAVTAVASGQVVHADTLRGFGRVIILRHPDQFYSLYAYLEDARVEVGQDVDGAQNIGTAGYFPKADGPGLYFELRSGKKVINPLTWLAK